MMPDRSIGKYMVLRHEYTTASGKTHEFSIWGASGDGHLGRIKWFPMWRRYCFFPSNGTSYDASCLTEIANCLKDLMASRSGQNGGSIDPHGTP